MGGALGVGLVAAIVWTLVSRRSVLDAAIELDLRFGLKERVSSSLSLSEDDLQSDAGRALVKDALKKGADSQGGSASGRSSTARRAKDQ